jgi:hypothetical protein
MVGFCEGMRTLIRKRVSNDNNVNVDRTPSRYIDKTG